MSDMFQVETALLVAGSIGYLGRLCLHPPVRRSKR